MAAFSFALARMRGMRSGVIPSGLDTISTDAPNASIVRRFSMAKASEVTMCRGWSVTAQTNASELPRAAAGVLDDRLARPRACRHLRRPDHGQRHPVLVRPGWIGRFQLHPDRRMPRPAPDAPAGRAVSSRSPANVPSFMPTAIDWQEPGEIRRERERSGRRRSGRPGQVRGVVEPLALQQFAMLDLAVPIKRRAGAAARRLDAPGLRGSSTSANDCVGPCHRAARPTPPARAHERHRRGR